MVLAQYGFAARKSTYEAAGEFLRYSRVGDERKNIYIDALFVVSRKIIAALNVEGVEIAHLDDGFFSGFYFWGLDKKIFGEFVLSHFNKACNIFLAHGNINVIVPRNEPLMADSSEECAAVEPIFNVVFAADFVNLHENGELLKLALTQGGATIFF